MSVDEKENVREENAPEDLSKLLEGAEGWDWNDMLSSPIKPEQKPPNAEPVQTAISQPSKSPHLPCTRCIIESVPALSSGRPALQVLTRIDHTSTRVLLLLSGDWALLPLLPGDVVNVHAPLIPPPSVHSPGMAAAVVSGAEGFIIHHPDVLLPPTMVSTASQCTRKPLVSSLLRSAPGGGDGGARAVLWGNLLHEVVQRCMTTTTTTANSPGTASSGWPPALIDEHTRTVLYSRAGVEGCFRAGVSVEEALAELRHRARGLAEFSQRFLRPVPGKEGQLTDGETWLALSRTRAVEEDVWSPSWGLKGKVDASVEVAVSAPRREAFFDKRGGTGGGGRELSKGTMPFEIKTGRASKGLEHRAQTMLYTLLLGERYGQSEITSGLLYYTQSAEVIQVDARRNELRALIMARNELAEWVMRRRRGLDVLSGRKGKGPKEHAHRERDGEATETELGDVEEAPFLPPPIDDSWACTKCYALDGCMLYRRTHDAPLSVPHDLEELYARKTSHLTPRHAAFFRTWERLISLEENDMNRFRSELWTMTAPARESAGRCFADMVLVPLREADEGLAEASGRIHRHTARFVKRLTLTQKGPETLLNGHISVGDAVVVSIDPGFLALGRGFVLSLAPESIVLGLDRAVDASALQDLPIKNKDALVWRIDKDELSSGVARLRDNLAQLFYADGDERRRALVVDLEPPIFSATPAFDPSHLSASLNAPQQAAIAKVAAAKDYALILGMPGTGKTSTIAEIIRMLVRQGKTVLLTSYTHSAVDTILLRLGEVEFDVLRLGNTDKVHPDVKKYTLGARPQATTVQQLEHQLLLPPVVATTCLSIDHPIGGLDVSLFRRLSDAHPEAVVDLTLQYRMNEDIMLLSNRLIYNDRLQCGSEEVARRSLVLKDKSPLHALHGGAPCPDCWLSALLDENCKAVFVDTDALPARDSRVGDLVQNPIEAQLVFQLTQMLMRCGVPATDIGLISLYRQQIKLLSHLFRDTPGLEILTADRSQGRDKQCIIVSMVRSNETGELGDLLKDWRRINVSFTRARAKLVIVGSRSTLGASALLKEFLELMEGKGWIYALPAGAHLRHAEQLGSQAQGESLKRVSEESEEDGDNTSVDTPAKKAKVENPTKRAILGDIINAL
ncbi:Dna2-domain-containing protein [Calocera viscosa TUFC12733]|uniref:DNA replication ATP-dependent helicase/nuclease DNA2 n=1 Tax=Calocera viscosa (strain TUFC12733) TaxID=1330018 RepID=A0A167KEX2_CALVF|nr:Dna2-domain-containing protein [Calocera viscosa TUFC12733]